MNQLSTKSCYKCKLVKELTEFANNNGYLTYCKPCNSEIQRDYKSKNREKLESYRRKWEQENVSKREVYASRWRVYDERAKAKDPEKFKAKDRASNRKQKELLLNGYVSALLRQSNQEVNADSIKARREQILEKRAKKISKQ